MGAPRRVPGRLSTLLSLATPHMSCVTTGMASLRASGSGRAGNRETCPRWQWSLGHRAIAGADAPIIRISRRHSGNAGSIWIRRVSTIRRKPRTQAYRVAEDRLGTSWTVQQMDAMDWIPDPVLYTSHCLLCKRQHLRMSIDPLVARCEIFSLGVNHAIPHEP